MQQIFRYGKDDLMAELITDNYSVLVVMSRFEIKLGFNEKTIGRVCKENKVDTATFLAIINLLLNKNNKLYRADLEGLDIGTLMIYLKKSHEFYLNTRFPELRIKMLRILGDDKISDLIIRYFDDYVNHIKGHLRYEEKKVFPYVESLALGKDVSGYSIKEFKVKHDNIEEPLTEFKNVIIKYYTGGKSAELMDVIHDLLHSAEDIATHNMIEDNIMVPLIMRMESGFSGEDDTTVIDKKGTGGKVELSQREKEIVAAIAYGKSNKEIAAELFISTYTVMTHRKNIAVKLKIHNSAGLTIYAIVNRLIDVGDVK